MTDAMIQTTAPTASSSFQTLFGRIAGTCAPPSTERSYAVLPPRAGEARLVREDHRLEAVAHSELRQHVLDVRLHRRGLDRQLIGDLGVGQAAGDQLEHLALARG